MDSPNKYYRDIRTRRIDAEILVFHRGQDKRFFINNCIYYIVNSN